MQLSGNTVIESGEFALSLVHQPGISEEDAARFRDGNLASVPLAACAVKQLDSDFLFEGTDLLADGWLAEVQHLRRLPKAHLFGDGAEHFEPKIFQAL